MFAHIIIDSRNPEADRTFDYKVPDKWEEEMQVGQRVIVPFGRRNAKTEGYVISLSAKTEVPLEKIKEILEILDEGKPVFTPSILALAQWMKKAYFCTLNQCLKAVMPAGIRTKSVWMIVLSASFSDIELSQQEESLLAFLKEEGGSVPVHDAEGEWDGRLQPVLQSLQEKGLVSLKQRVWRSDYKQEKRLISLCTDESLWKEAWEKAKKDKRLSGQARVLALLTQEEKMERKALKEQAAVTDSPIQTLLKKGILQEVRQEEKRDVFCVEDYQETKPFQPTAEQANALALIREEKQKENKRPVLLHGITGSGKTEIYMQLIADTLAEGKQAVVLVPEISLTPLIMERFISRFGRAVSVTHSRLSMGERLDQWKKARDGEVSVMIGPRSALFMPFPRLGIIVMDESHENSYVSDITPKYHTRDVAQKLSEITGALFVMGSATPDLDSYYHATQGDFCLIELKERTKHNTLPEGIIVDMRKELEEGNRSPFSKALRDAVAENLEKKEQTMLFLNRRGYATFVSCRACGEALTCPQCNITYTYHAKENALLCHYCGRQVPIPKVCPSCGSKYIRYFGTGTQKIEEEVHRLFPQATVLRMDLDTTGTKHSHEQILELFGSGKADILVGTQMIAKGHDFPKVTLVGIMAADLSLHGESYMATETCFQLITQAAGRAGRGELPGKVYIQTYSPDHYTIQLAAKQDYKGFYEQEIQMRNMMEYPPFFQLFSVLITGEKEEDTIQAAVYLGSVMAYYNQKTGFSILGPSPAALSKFRGEYRWRILVKGKDGERLKAFAVYCMEKAKKKWGRKARFHGAFNPRDIV